MRSSSLAAGSWGERSVDCTRRAGRRAAGSALRAGGSCYRGFSGATDPFPKAADQGMLPEAVPGLGAQAGGRSWWSPTASPSPRAHGAGGKGLFQSFFSAKPPLEPPSLNAVLKSFFSSVPCRVISARDQSHLLRPGAASTNEPRGAGTRCLGRLPRFGTEKRAKISETPS